MKIYFLVMNSKRCNSNNDSNSYRNNKKLRLSLASIVLGQRKDELGRYMPWSVNLDHRPECCDTSGTFCVVNSAKFEFSSHMCAKFKLKRVINISVNTLYHQNTIVPPTVQISKCFPCKKCSTLIGSSL